MDVHLINLDRGSDRLARFKEINGHVGNVHRFAAVDGAAADIPSLIARGFLGPGIRRFYSAGAIGCALSHIALWEQVALTGKNSTICEDDAIFHARFDALSAQLLGQLPADWDLVYWGWNYDSPLAFTMPGMATCLALCDYENVRVKTADFQNYAVAPTMVRLEQAFGTVCYSLSPAAARALLAFCLPIRWMQVPSRATKRGLMPNIGIDVMMSAAFGGLKAFASLPPLVVAQYDWDASTIRGQTAQSLTL
jgi:GR25 family glycosyltransferase involved in LPS biosynthesis